MFTNQAIIDYIGQNQISGDVAAYMQRNKRLDIGAMRPFVANDGRTYVSVYTGGDRSKPENYKSIPLQTNGTLRRDEWKQLDEVILPVARTRLNGIQDLIDKGLTYNLGNALGTTVLEYHDISDGMNAVISMDGVTRGEGDRVKYTSNYLPIPVIHVDYEINLRELEASRSLGNPISTDEAEQATRRVSEKLESMLFTSYTYTFGNGTIYSYLNHPSRNIVSFSDSQAWDASGKTKAEILTDVITMKRTSINNKHYGPWTLYVPTAYETVLDEDYDTTTPGTTLRERIMKINGIDDIKVIDTLTADNVLLVEMTSQTVRLVRGMGIQNVEWQTEGNWITKYKVLTIQVPQIRADQDGNSGIVHMS